jgi:hypothetical protein
MQCIARLGRARLIRLNEELQSRVREAAISGDKELANQLREQVFANKKMLYALYASNNLMG